MIHPTDHTLSLCVEAGFIFLLAAAIGWGREWLIGRRDRRHAWRRGRDGR